MPAESLRGGLAAVAARRAAAGGDFCWGNGGWKTSYLGAMFGFYSDEKVELVQSAVWAAELPLLWCTPGGARV